jgi:hypothetical protein
VIPTVYSFFKHEYWKTDCVVMQNLALLLTKIRSLVHEEISLLTVLYFPIFRVPEYSELLIRVGIRS